MDHIPPGVRAKMEKRVQFAAPLVAVIPRSTAQGDSHQSSSPLAASSGSSFGWYTSKELRAIRKGIHALVDSEKDRKGCQSSQHETRGLEIFLSKVRKDLQRHYARTVLEAQRRIKQTRRLRVDLADTRDDDVMLRGVAEKYSEYARDRAHQIALRDQDDSRRLNGSFIISSSKHNNKEAVLASSSSKKRVLVDHSQRIGRKRPNIAPCGVLVGLNS
ncbi:expressed unknown protein [Seminavis robusta]|uniref:Uncharacterized protein n=1 Tax=Seminavis robusta TaxID=568900 RepID=A0A9N8HCK4_9STRA|nr:expressed unknown protein [Seminavis robusta]|eukprot:Sro386_g131900.1 n/a (217) ;mRNA; f:41213-41863